MRWRQLTFALGLALAPGLVLAQAKTLLPVDKVVTAERCGECHVQELEVWKQTPHATGFRTLHPRARAEEIAEKMGFRLIKRESLCLSCHYTPIERSGSIRAVSGVSCESCHGAGADYLEVHNDYGPGADHTTETAEHRRQRIAASREAGMRRPSDLYDVARSCFECHSVPEEELVNVGGHSVGTAGFELVEKSQGMIRHNFLAAQRGGAQTNVERPDEHKRLLYVAGRAADLEASLRGIAAASQRGTYSSAMTTRARKALGEILEISTRAKHPELDAIVRAVRDVRLRVGEGTALLAAADRVAESARRWIDARDQHRLASLDPLLRGEVDVADAADASAPSPEEGFLPDPPATAEPTEDTGVESAAVESPAATTPAAGASDTQPAPAVSAAPTRSYERKSQLRTVRTEDVLPVGTCTRCHDEQRDWWFGDAHSTSAEPFADQAEDASRIARAYGIKPSFMARGNQLCMDCHGTIAKGQSTRLIFDGVSCQSCHGGGENYLEVHDDGDKALGLNRPGYVQALDRGMRELKNQVVRTQNCASCHYITDPRLLSTGHPDGSQFDPVANLASVKHWEDPLPAAGDVRQGWLAELARRGPIPSVVRARLEASAPTPGARPGTITTAVPGASSEPGVPAAAASTAVDPASNVATSVAAGAQDAASQSTAPDEPASSAEIAARVPAISISDRLYDLKAQLDRLYAQLAARGIDP